MTTQDFMIKRRTLLAASMAAAASSSAPASTLVAGVTPPAGDANESATPSNHQFWPNNARLAITFSLMFEAGGQPISGAPGFIDEPMQKGLPDMATNGIFQYGVYEGIPRILDLMDKHQVKVTSFMIGQAVDKAPDLAREIVKRGHEAAAHGRTWQNSYLLDPDAERRFIMDGVESIHRATGQTPVGWNGYYVRNSPRTFDILQSLGFKYHIDEPSADQPFIIKLKGGDFVTVPYTFHMNDMFYPFTGFNPAAYEQALKDEFDQLYEEGGHRRRMMVIGLHDRVSGHANRVRVLDRFLTYARSKSDVWFARKDEIAAWAQAHRDITPAYERGAPTVTGLPGSAS
jgi:peptidoglycan/xylan/chitin deacetylase (PgdA/CDA1 family)